ncbi:hypothetical protein HanXRQr2_Chr13g0609631 [Helianthus annuus]|uniref:Uncharacterized protein n=1 Tax=Helianthus annuus TaxID=4232 RepID=A0A9K3EK52_HELAN|nr:hypothetical protein HanXRQr2_Chr13g0609631 [Helianthus annuus]
MLKSPQMEGSFRLEVGQLLRYMLSAQLPFNIIIIIIIIFWVFVSLDSVNKFLW